LFQAPRFGQDDWTLDVVVQFVTIQSAHTTVSEITNVPAIFQPAHTTLLQGTTACDRGTREATRGIDDRDVALIEAATASIEECGTKMREATALIPQQD